MAALGLDLQHRGCFQPREPSVSLLLYVVCLPATRRVCVFVFVCGGGGGLMCMCVFECVFVFGCVFMCVFALFGIVYTHVFGSNTNTHTDCVGVSLDVFLCVFLS